ncbi:X-ray repair cross-complementing protein 6 [Rhineura floridana]|uniref:X-ray repair cross-complementing protein 6 n=1 Tax=Rhineura floridana TaxID=261503 RepID=UPI002AC8128B|nr:X-ray repair cross-complementing protein 6 [Rhineura floridana]XP_061495271.1 X-ray repair cross-complementing protein 6 [Rhineura floridana]XP_061495272.1 X-ray repair cross-complementing protein 6 [Rhineura floridana]XP_061495273.1 X-ray repair cross-complementing protein 6 [Rhineura floridana]XP_061495274.1 X-ray repair cross-complementing protein 6 [Rhineura floridana]XP_061495275.1 X-ray repair cross-complementing protein 6 [Rhineura floridana]
MSDWVSYYKNEEGEEEEEQNEEAETIGEYKYSGRDTLLFLVDASKAMFDFYDNGDLTPFDMTIQCIQNVYTNKIISHDRDLVGVVFYGTEQHKNSVDFKHIYVLQDLDNPGAKRVLELAKYKGEQGKALFHKSFGHSADYSLGEAFWVCSNLFSDVRLKMSHKRIMQFTNEDNPHGQDSTNAKFARTKAADLRETGIYLDLMHLKKPGGFDISLFYRDIINTAEDEGLGVHFDESGKLEDLMKKVRAKEMRKRTLSRLNLFLGKDVALTVGVFNLIQKAFKQPPVKLYRETNEPVKTKTRTFNRQTGSLLLPSDTKRAQTYGNRQIVLEKEETEEVKRFHSPGLYLIGFKPLVLLKRHHHIRPAQFIYPDESLISGSTTLFNALLTKCLEKGVMVICTYTPRHNTPPRFIALVPQEEELDEQNVQTAPSGFHLIFLPYADDKRKVDVMEKVPANQEQVNKMKEIVQKLCFKYRSDSFENPVLQQHYMNLEALALDLLEPEKAEDLTLPKVEVMDERLASLAEEFKQLVYPPGYNPDGKTAKRKQGNDTGQPEKKAKTDISEEELRNHIQKGTLGKLTVPVLKDVCRNYRLVGGAKKQELLDAVTEYFSKH